MILIFLFNIWGYYPVFLLQQYKIRSEVRAFVYEGHKKPKVVFTFNLQQLAELRWIKNDEFVLNENYYDILIREQNPDGTVTFFCYLDTKEKNLVDHLHRHISRNADDKANQQSNNKKVVNIPIKDYLSPNFGLVFYSWAVPVSYQEREDDLKNPFLKAEVPPPRLV